jgi:hypothetical protein
MSVAFRASVDAVVLADDRARVAAQGPRRLEAGDHGGLGAAEVEAAGQPVAGEHEVGVAAVVGAQAVARAAGQG